jgi:hypothetical protein
MEAERTCLEVLVQTKGRSFTFSKRKRNPTVGTLWKKGFYTWVGLPGRYF